MDAEVGGHDGCGLSRARGRDTADGDGRVVDVNGLADDAPTAIIPAMGADDTTEIAVRSGGDGDRALAPERGAVATAPRSPFEPDTVDAEGEEATPTSGPPSGKPDDPTTTAREDLDYSVWTRAELYGLAQELRIPGHSRMSREQLIDALRQY